MSKTKEKKSALIIKRPDGETIEFYIGKEMVASANHDYDGWAGMSTLENGMLAMANAIGMKVIDEG